MAIHVGLCELDLHLPFADSLRAKQRVLKSIAKRARKEFNVAVSEVDFQDEWRNARIAIVTVSGSSPHAHGRLRKVLDWIEDNFPDDVQIIGEETTMI